MLGPQWIRWRHNGDVTRSRSFTGRHVSDMLVVVHRTTTTTTINEFFPVAQRYNYSTPSVCGCRSTPALFWLILLLILLLQLHPVITQGFKNHKTPEQTKPDFEKTNEGVDLWDQVSNADELHEITGLLYCSQVTVNTLDARNAGSVALVAHPAVFRLLRLFSTSYEPVLTCNGNRSTVNSGC